MSKSECKIIPIMSKAKTEQGTVTPPDKVNVADVVRMAQERIHPYTVHDLLTAVKQLQVTNRGLCETVGGMADMLDLKHKRVAELEKRPTIATLVSAIRKVLPGDMCESMIEGITKALSPKDGE